MSWQKHMSVKPLGSFPESQKVKEMKRKKQGSPTPFRDVFPVTSRLPMRPHPPLRYHRLSVHFLGELSLEGMAQRGI